MRLPESLVEALGDSYRAALDGGLEPFPRGVPEATPINSGPYLIDLATFSTDFGFNDRRKRQLNMLEQSLDALRSIGLSPHFLVAGGSYVDLEQPDPKDLDCALFYSCATGAPTPPSDALVRIQRAGVARGLDLRLLPFDAHPALAAKMIGFFVLLYTRNRAPGHKEAVVVVDLSE